MGVRDCLFGRLLACLPGTAEEAQRACEDHEASQTRMSGQLFLLFRKLTIHARGSFYMQENTLSSKFVGLDERSPKQVLNFPPDKVGGY